MADLQDELRRAFRRRLSDHPASPDLRTRVAAAVGEAPPRRSPGWLPAVAVMAGLLIVAGSKAQMALHSADMTVSDQIPQKRRELFVDNLGNPAAGAL